MGTRPVLGILLLVSLAAGRVPVLLADVNQEHAAPFSRSTSQPVDFFRVGDRLLFSTRGGYDDDSILWSTDGTAEGTRAVSSSLCPRPCQSIRPLAVWRGLGFFETSSSEGYSPGHLWRTDGTTFYEPHSLTFWRGRLLIS